MRIFPCLRLLISTHDTVQLNEYILCSHFGVFTKMWSGVTNILQNSLIGSRFLHSHQAHLLDITVHPMEYTYGLSCIVCLWLSILFCVYMDSCDRSGIILCMCPANERRRYNVTSSLIVWAHSQNDPSSTHRDGTKLQQKPKTSFKPYLYHFGKNCTWRSYIVLTRSLAWKENQHILGVY